MTQKRSKNIVLAGFISTIATMGGIYLLELLDLPTILKATLLGIILMPTMIVPLYIFTIDRDVKTHAGVASSYKNRLYSSYRNIILFLYGALAALAPILILNLCAYSETHCIFYSRPK